MKKTNKFAVALLAISLGMGVQTGKAINVGEVHGFYTFLINGNDQNLVDGLTRIVNEIGTCPLEETIEILRALTGFSFMANLSKSGRGLKLNEGSVKAIDQLLPLIIRNTNEEFATNKDIKDLSNEIMQNLATV